MIALIPHLIPALFNSLRVVIFWKCGFSHDTYVSCENNREINIYGVLNERQKNCYLFDVRR